STKWTARIALFIDDGEFTNWCFRHHLTNSYWKSSYNDIGIKKIKHPIRKIYNDSVVWHPHQPPSYSYEKLRADDWAKLIHIFYNNDLRRVGDRYIDSYDNEHKSYLADQPL